MPIKFWCWYSDLMRVPGDHKKKKYLKIEINFKIPCSKINLIAKFHWNLSNLAFSKFWSHYFAGKLNFLKMTIFMSFVSNIVSVFTETWQNVDFHIFSVILSQKDSLETMRKFIFAPKINALSNFDWNSKKFSFSWVLMSWRKSQNTIKKFWKMN